MPVRFSGVCSRASTAAVSSIDNPCEIRSSMTRSRTASLAGAVLVLDPGLGLHEELPVARTEVAHRRQAVAEPVSDVLRRPALVQERPQRLVPAGAWGRSDQQELRTPTCWVPFR